MTGLEMNLAVEDIVTEKISTESQRICLAFNVQYINISDMSCDIYPNQQSTDLEKGEEYPMNGWVGLSYRSGRG